MNENIPLSAAIRLGSMLKPQHFGGYYSPDGTASCALGAALDAIGEPECEEDIHFPVLQLIEDRECPACGDAPRWTDAIIPHLNDDHEWSRERIADQVEIWERESIEQLSPVPERELEVVK